MAPELKYFSLANPRGDDTENVVLLLRRFAEYLEPIRTFRVRDLTYSTDETEGGFRPHLTVYYEELVVLQPGSPQIHIVLNRGEDGDPAGADVFVVDVFHEGDRSAANVADMLRAAATTLEELDRTEIVDLAFSAVADGTDIHERLSMYI